jgi:hypothetical protein
MKWKYSSSSSNVSYPPRDPSSYASCGIGIVVRPTAVRSIEEIMTACMAAEEARS